MLEDSTRTAIINKEIETYRKFAVALESLKQLYIILMESVLIRISLMH